MRLIQPMLEPVLRREALPSSLSEGGDLTCGVWVVSLLWLCNLVQLQEYSLLDCHGVTCAGSTRRVCRGVRLPLQIELLDMVHTWRWEQNELFLQAFPLCFLVQVSTLSRFLRL